MKRSAKLMTWAVLLGVAGLVVALVTVATNHMLGIIFVVFFAAMSTLFYFWSNITESKEKHHG